MKHVKMKAAHTANEAWLTGVLALIPDSVYGRTKGEAPQASALAKQKKKKGKQAKGKKLPEMPEKMAKLQQALRDKIAERRAERKADDEKLVSLREGRKKKRVVKKATKSAVAAKARRKRKRDAGEASEEEDEASGDDEVEETEGEKPAGEIEVSRVDGVAEEDATATKKASSRKKKRHRLNELENQLDEAVAARDEDDSNVRLENEMDKAMARAQGVVVKDDVGKLRKTIRKEKRKSVKSKEEWAKRVEAADQEKDSRQKKREDNLKERREEKGAKGKKKKGAKAGGKSGKHKK